MVIETEMISSHKIEGGKFFQILLKKSFRLDWFPSGISSLLSIRNNHLHNSTASFNYHSHR